MCKVISIVINTGLVEVGGGMYVLRKRYAFKELFTGVTNDEINQLKQIVAHQCFFMLD